MKNIEFKTKSAKRIYSDYLERVKSMTQILSLEDQVEILMEINSHIFEAIQKEPKKDEVENLLEVTESLGRPEDFLIPLVAEKKIIQARKSFNPIHVWQALKLNIANGVIYSVISLLYLFLTVFGFLIIAKIFVPKNTGLFYVDDKFRAFGFVTNSDQMNEVLGYWFIPITLAIAIIFYLGITLIFRIIKKK